MDDDERKGAHGRRLLAELLDLAPRAHRRRRRNELNRPHFVEARVAVVAGEYVHGVVVDDGAVGGARRRRIARIPRHPVAGGEAVLVQVVLVAQVLFLIVRLVKFGCFFVVAIKDSTQQTSPVTRHLRRILF